MEHTQGLLLFYVFFFFQNSRFNGLGLVNDGLGTDFEKTYRVQRNIILIKQIMDN